MGPPVLSVDLANVFVGFDTLLTMDQVGTALNELAAGEFYGSLTALATTAPFVDAISSRRIPAGATGFNLRFAPTGRFADFEGDSAVGSRSIETVNYGGSAGFGVATGNVELGAGLGYGRIEANSVMCFRPMQIPLWSELTSGKLLATFRWVPILSTAGAIERFTGNAYSFSRSSL